MRNRAEVEFLSRIYSHKRMMLMLAYKIEFGVQFSNNGNENDDDDDNNNSKPHFFCIYTIIPAIQMLRSLSVVKPTRCTICQISFYFGTTLYMFRTVSPFINMSLILYIQHYTTQVL